MPETRKQAASSPVDDSPRLVRFGRITERGFVEFSFGIGSTDLMVELVLPVEAYHEFCKTHRVVYLTREQEQALDHDQSKWRFGSPGITE